MERFEDYGIIIPYGKKAGKVKTTCPQCSKSRGNPKDRSLSVDLDKGVWNCHHCSWSGCLRDDRIKPHRQYTRPQPRPASPVPPKVSAYFVSRGISQSTLEKAGVDVGMEFMPQDGKEMRVIRFNFYLGGELVNTKFRTGNKHFKLIPDAELPPYNVDAIKGKTECIITEGEIDCLSFIEAGRDDVVSIPNGAKSLGFLDEYMDLFDDKETIYVAVDTDDAGISARDELVRRLGAERCRIVTYGEGCKDANEHLVAHGKESLVECLDNARDVKIDGVFSIADYEDSLDLIYRHGLQRGMVIGHENFDRLISFETKRLCIVTGIPSSGKSEFIDEMVIRLNVRYGCKAAFFSPENMPISLHATKIIEKLTGCELSVNSMPERMYSQAKAYMEDNFFHILPEDGNTLTNILAKARYLVRRRGIRILVLDPFNRIDNDLSDRLSETRQISLMLDQMTDFAQRNDVLVILMAHPYKITKDNSDNGVPTLYNINGSAHFYNKADYGIIVHRYKGASEAERYTLVRVSKVKFRHLGEGGDAGFKYDVRNGRYAPFPLEGETFRCEFRTEPLIDCGMEYPGTPEAREVRSPYQDFLDPDIDMDDNPPF